MAEPRVYVDQDGDRWYEQPNGTFSLRYEHDGHWSELHSNRPLEEIRDEHGLKLVAGIEPEPMMADRERVQFKGGGMRDTQVGKPRFDLLMPERVPYDKQYLTRVARLMGKGAEHYEDRNWERFADEQARDRAKASAFRHFMQWFNGETDEDHAAAIFFNVQAVEYINGRLRGEW